LGANIRGDVHMLICKYCGKEFEAKSKSGRKPSFCSTKCRNKARYEPVRITKICPVCGKEFQAKPKVQLYCSSECSNKSRYRREYIIKKCLFCGKEFKAKKKTHVYCSENCRRSMGKKKGKTNICKWCGKTFKARNDNLGFCSRSCASKYAHKKNVKTKQCVVCGGPFKGKGKYCSSDCYEISKIKRCSICGKEFKSDKANAKYCSDECKKQHNRERDKRRAINKHNKNKKSHKCKYCGKIFVPEYGFKKRTFCSNQCSKKYQQGKKGSEPKKYINRRISKAIQASLKRKGASKNYKHWEDIVGYTLDDLKERLESQFKQGMSWDNYGKWHIDHIRPVASFKFESFEDEDFKLCWSLNNLQPLWAKDNVRKADKWDGQNRLPM